VQCLNPPAYHGTVRLRGVVVSLGLGLVVAALAGCSRTTSETDAAAQASRTCELASRALASATAGSTLIASGLTTTLADERAIGSVSKAQWKNLKGSTKITTCVFDSTTSRASESIIDCPPGQEAEDDALTSRTYLVAPDGSFVVARGSGPTSGSQMCVSAAPS